MTFKQLIKKKGLTQRDLAQRLGVSQPAVSSWMHGLYRPRSKQLQPLAKALGVSVSTLVKCFEQEQ